MEGKETDWERIEFSLKQLHKIKTAGYESFFDEHHAYLACIPVFINEAAKRQGDRGEWFEVFEPLTYQIISLSYALENALDGTIHGKHSPTPVTRLDLPIVFILARAQLEAYLTFYYLFVQPLSNEEHMLRYQLYVASGLSMRQELIKTQRPEFAFKLKLEKERIDSYRSDINANKVFNTYQPSRQGQLLTSHPKKPARVKGWEQLIEDCRLQTDLFKKSWSLYSNHAHAEYIGLIQTRSYLSNPEDASRLQPHTLHKSLMIIAVLLKDLIKIFQLDEYYQSFELELRFGIDFWEKHASDNK